MKERTAYIAALPREIAPLVKGWRTDTALAVKGIALFWNEDAIVACAGIGQHRVALAVEAALAVGSVSRLVSVGVAGACNAALLPGAVLRPSTVVDIRTGERFQAQEGDGSTLATATAIANPAEKARLYASYNAHAVDMEAAQVARMAAQRGLQFAAIKSLSDAADFEFPSTMRFVSPTGQFDEFRFALFVACRPQLWRPVLKLARGSKLAIASLCAAIHKELAEKA